MQPRLSLQLGAAAALSPGTAATYLGTEVGNQDSGLQHGPRAGKPEDLWLALSLSRALTPSIPVFIQLGTKEIEKHAVLSGVLDCW